MRLVEGTEERWKGKYSFPSSVMNNSRNLVMKVVKEPIDPVVPVQKAWPGYRPDSGPEG